jgi:hypothetical protein
MKGNEVPWAAVLPCDASINDSTSNVIEVQPDATIEESTSNVIQVQDMESIEGQDIDKHYTLKHWTNPAPLERNHDRCWVKSGSENYKSIAVKGWHNSQYISDNIMKKMEAPWTAALSRDASIEDSTSNVIQVQPDATIEDSTSNVIQTQPDATIEETTLNDIQVQDMEVIEG